MDYTILLTDASDWKTSGSTSPDAEVSTPQSKKYLGMNTVYVDGSGLAESSEGDIIVVSRKSNLLKPEEDPDLEGKILDTLQQDGRAEFIEYIDPSMPGISDGERERILRERYQDKIVQDGLRSGHFVLDEEKGEMKVAIQQPFSVVAGYILEAFITRICNQEREKGKKIFKFATERERLHDKTFDRFHAIGTGSTRTENEYPQYYSPSNPQNDILFVTEEDEEVMPASVVGSSRLAGIQVKAIKSNEYQQIVSPVSNGKYDKVLTLLKHPDGRYSYDECIDKINEHIKDPNKREEMRSKIKHPRQVGIDQRRVEEYYKYIRYWYRGQAEADKAALQGVGLSIHDSIHLEDSAATSLPD